MRLLLLWLIMFGLQASPIIAEASLVRKYEDDSRDLPYEYDPEFFALKVPVFKMRPIDPRSALNDLNESVIRELRGSIDLMDWESRSPADDLPDPKTIRYNRAKQYGPWMPDPSGKTCYNTRALVLIRDAKAEVIFVKDLPCFVASSKWLDPYTNQEFTDARDIEIDHVVPLKQSFLAGAWRWKTEIKCNYANYMGFARHLLPVSKIENRNKSDKTPADYLPPHREYWCSYVETWLQIKAIWNLFLSAQEAQSIQKIVAQEDCQFKGLSYTDLRKLRKMAVVTSKACQDFAHGRLPPGLDKSLLQEESISGYY